MWNEDAQELADNLAVVVAIWREAENQGEAGMVGVAWSIQNRAIKLGVTPHAVITQKTENADASVVLKRWQYSSMSALGDPGLMRWPAPGDPNFLTAFKAWTGVQNGSIPDPTGSATLYYADWIAPPPWTKSPNVKFTVKIGSQLFYKES